ncbi:hypothetical protein NG754_10780 [Aliarcobacter cryaerophilus]|uniref:hypothetical protein n=1 Tax=Aliarcobacter cryaerophilus TaxID=28198 RepID=UPI003DA2FF27
MISTVEGKFPGSNSTFNTSLSVVVLSIILSLTFSVLNVPFTVSSPFVSAKLSTPVVKLPVPLI